MSSVTKSAGKGKKTKGRGARPKSILKRQFQFTENGKTRRESLYIGQRKAEEIAVINAYVDDLLEAKRYGSRLPEPTRVWLREIESREPELIAKLKAVGLVDDTDNPKVAEFVDGFIDRKRLTRKPGTVFLCEQVASDLKLWFAGKRVSEVTQADAKGFWHWLITGDEKRKKLGENTAKRRLGRAREVFNEAIEYEIISRNPFAVKSLTVSVGAGKKDYVPAATIHAVIDYLATIDREGNKLEWRLLFAFGRFIGCRMPSEIRELTWSDVNFEANTILLKSPKTERKGKAERMVPIFPEVRELLQAQSDRAELGGSAEAAVYVFPRLRNHSNAATTAAKMVNAAGFTSWPKFWNSLRASCETDLMDQYGLRKACAWIGNSPAVAMKHYALMRREDYTDAGQVPKSAAGLVAGHTENHADMAQHAGKTHCTDETRNSTDLPKTKQNVGLSEKKLPRMDSNHE